MRTLAIEARWGNDLSKAPNPLDKLKNLINSDITKMIFIKWENNVLSTKLTHIDSMNVSALFLFYVRDRQLLQANKFTHFL